MLTDFANAWLGFITTRILVSVLSGGRFTGNQATVISFALGAMIFTIGEWGLGVALALRPLVAGFVIGALDAKYGSRCGVPASRITAASGGSG